MQKTEADEMGKPIPDKGAAQTLHCTCWKRGTDGFLRSLDTGQPQYMYR